MGKYFNNKLSVIGLIWIIFCSICVSASCIDTYIKGGDLIVKDTEILMVLIIFFFIVVILPGYILIRIGRRRFKKNGYDDFETGGCLIKILIIIVAIGLVRFVFFAFSENIGAGFTSATLVVAILGFLYKKFKDID
ncbi:hypothetical protein [Aquimarina megaterium]|uniref:hypothetical protein n=1 Tax=Aquimarina megaterium TaxID=1443666 RepID=UPI0004701490|nr:hypothetical protein [Aquimarina megaterium]